jgi:hypothetical protein
MGYTSPTVPALLTRLGGTRQYLTDVRDAEDLTAKMPADSEMKPATAAGGKGIFGESAEQRFKEQMNQKDRQTMSRIYSTSSALTNTTIPCLV